MGNEKQAGIGSQSVSKIRTSFVHPPIPVRHFDWVAWIDGDEETGFYGHGRNESEAISELINLQAQFDEENQPAVLASRAPRDVENAAEAAYTRFMVVAAHGKPLEPHEQWGAIPTARRNDWMDAVEAAAPFLQEREGAQSDEYIKNYLVQLGKRTEALRLARELEG